MSNRSTIDEEVSNNVCGGNSEAAPNIKKCTSCDQKTKENTSRSSIDAVSSGINNMNISNDIITLNGAADSISPGTSTSTSDSCEIGKLLSIVDDNLSICANCGKEGDDIKNICNKCKKATYCNAACKKKHRHKHKNDCEEHVRLAAEKDKEELRLL